MMLRRKLVSLFKSRTGHMAVMTALLALPLFGMVGLAVDTARALMVRDQMIQAADAAVLDCVSASGLRDIRSAGNGGMVDAAKLRQRKMFDGQIDAARLNFELLRDIRFAYAPGLTISGTSVRARFAVKTEVPTMFLRVLNINSITVSHVSTAASQPLFSDIYLLLDNSPSMGIAATRDDMKRLRLLTRGPIEVNAARNNCEFACHDLSDPNSSYKVARANYVRLRFDLIRNALPALGELIRQSRFGVGDIGLFVYTLAAKAEDQINRQGDYIAAPRNVGNLRADMSQLYTIANSIDIMTVPDFWYSNRTGSYISSAITSMKSVIGTSGDGLAPATPQKLLMIVTDGVENMIRPGTDCGGLSMAMGDDAKLIFPNKSHCIKPIEETDCGTLKKNGVRIAILYTTYPDLVDPTYTTYVKPQADSMTASLKACASPDLFAETQDFGTIPQDMYNLLAKALNTSRLTN